MNTDGHDLWQTFIYQGFDRFGIAAIVGAGIFSTIGKASLMEVLLLFSFFIYAAFCLRFAALLMRVCVMVPVSGSA
jgi:hypothetical protein